jgi:hypothetical protein
MALQRFREQSADHGVVFDDQSALSLHRIASLPAPPSFTEAATLSNNPERSATSPDLGEASSNVVRAVASLSGDRRLAGRDAPAGSDAIVNVMRLRAEKDCLTAEVRERLYSRTPWRCSAQ